MKANELMIGDWVLFSGELKRVKSIVVSDNGVERIYVFGNTCQVSTINAYIQPIPLTPEILKKNGWEYNNYNNETEYEEEYYVDENGFDIHINGKNFEVRCIDAVNIQLKYLHELQHALKLCGIEKTIEL